MNNLPAEECGLLCPDRTWIPWNELRNSDVFGKGKHGLSDTAVSEIQFTLSAGAKENKMQLHSLGVNRESRDL